MNAGALRAALGEGAPLDIAWVRETGSTNADLLAAARSGVELGVPRLLVADRQTAGRGRQGRHWSSVPRASLTFSLAWSLERSDLSGLSLAIGTALADAIDPASGRLALKWPNDLWLVDAAGGGRKVGGILIETAPAGQRRVAVIGIGLNVLEQRVDDAASGVAWLREIDAEATPFGILRLAVPALLDALARFERAGFAAFAERFAARDLLRGRAVRCSAGASSAAVEGTALGVAPTGELLVRNAAGSVERIVSGEVSVRLAGNGASMAREATGSSC
jgi:BirA family biotin operon repressor/biotin-[acetyl-CoA-carboxylase] ligase